MSPEPETCLGVDVGGRRVGLAVSGGSGRVATALRTVDLRETGEGGAVDEVVSECREREVSVVVIGWPLRLDGSEGRAVDRVRDFIERLEEALEEAYTTSDVRPPTVEQWDERMTSSEVDTALRETEMTRERRDSVVDKLAATRILQSYLDSSAAGDAEEEPS